MSFKIVINYKLKPVNILCTELYVNSHGRFSARNTSFLTFSGNKHDLFWETIWPALVYYCLPAIITEVVQLFKFLQLNTRVKTVYTCAFVQNAHAQNHVCTIAIVN